MIITLGYDAISKNVEGLGMSPFILFSLSASAIFPACLVLLLIQDRIGRKAMASSSLLVSGIFTATAGIVIAYQKQLDPMLIAILSVVGRFGVTIAYNSGAQYATELIPTCVRGQGVSAAHVAGYALTFFSPYILYSVSDSSHLPKSRISSNQLSFDIVFSPRLYQKLNPPFCLGTILQSPSITDPWCVESYRRLLLFISTGNFKSVCKLSKTQSQQNRTEFFRKNFLLHSALSDDNQIFLWFSFRKIPVTLQDGEEFGRGEKFYHFACFGDEGRSDSESLSNYKGATEKSQE